MIQSINFDELIFDYNAANLRLILLDYDGTLVPFERDPGLSRPGLNLRKMLQALAEDRRNHVTIISGRDRDDLEAALGDLPLVLAAEHGALYRNPGDTWRSVYSISADWTIKVLPAVKALTFQYDGSFLECKTYSLAWHYRAISERIMESDKRQIMAALRSLPQHNQFLICDDEFTVELRTPGIDKGSFVARWIGSRHYDFIMAIGDGRTDEDMFEIFDQKSYTIKVGTSERSAANFHLRNQADVVPFIEDVIRVNRDIERINFGTGLEGFRK